MTNTMVGEVPELAVRANEESKPEVLRWRVGEAREAMESATRTDKQPPPWVQAFMSPARWERYQQLREEAGRSHQTIAASAEPAPHTGGSWFLSDFGASRACFLTSTRDH